MGTVVEAEKPSTTNTESAKAKKIDDVPATSCKCRKSFAEILQLEVLIKTFKKDLKSSKV